MTTSYIRWFETLSKSDVIIAGGKGANLGEMTRAGLPVPPGFAVSAGAYRDFIAAGLSDLMTTRIEKLNVEDHVQLEATATELQAAIRSTAVPARIAEELTAA